MGDYVDDKVVRDIAHWSRNGQFPDIDFESFLSMINFQKYS